MTTTTPVRRRVYPGIDQLVLRSLVVVGAATTLVAAQAAGAPPGPWHQAVMLVLAIATALRPDSIAGVALLAGSAYSWARAPETLTPLVLLAAGGMVLVHVSALVAAQGPARMRVDGAQVRRWSARAVVLWLAASAVWGISVLMVDLTQQRLAYALGLTLLAVLAVATTWIISARPEPSTTRAATLGSRTHRSTTG
ncbi:MAG: hypothetical protein ABWX73_07525 [Marmoricola sp.]